MKTLRLILFLSAFLLVLTGLNAQDNKTVSISTTNPSVTSNNAVFTGQNVPVSMDVEHVYTLSYTVKNTGDVTWKTGDYKLKVTVTAMDVSKDNKWLVPSVDIPADVAPGGEVTITFKVTAWNDNGDYTFLAQMGKNETAFGQTSTSVTVNVH